MKRNSIHNYCDILLQPNKNRIDIILRVVDEPLDTILDVTLQDGFPSWNADFFVIEKWVWEFVDYELIESTFKYKANVLLEKLSNVKVKQYSTEWSAKIFLKKLLNGSFHHSKQTKIQLRKLSKEAIKKGVTGFQKGYTVSEYTRRKMSHSKVGKKYSEKHKKAIKEGIRKNPMTQEHRLRFAYSNKVKGENHPKAILTKENVISLIQLYNTGNYTQKELADQFGVKESVVKHIVNGRSWKSVTSEYPITFKKETKVTKELVYELMEQLKSNTFNKVEFMERHQLDRSTINRILNGDTWGHITGFNKQAIKPSINQEIVLEMVRLFQSGDFTKKQLEHKFEVSRATVSRIFRGLIWSDVTGIVPKQKIS